jgi:hypothetical protein
MEYSCPSTKLFHIVHLPACVLDSLMALTLSIASGSIEANGRP